MHAKGLKSIQTVVEAVARLEAVACRLAGLLVESGLLAGLLVDSGPGCTGPP